MPFERLVCYAAGMSKSTLAVVLGGCLVIAILFSCVSRSFLDQRFDESESLAAPSLTGVTIADSNNFTFAAVGDTHVDTDDSRFRRILQAATAEGDSFVILLGDIIDRGSLDGFARVKQAITDLGWTNKVIPVIGNHEIMDEAWTRFKTDFGPSHFAVTLGNSRFIVADTADGLVGKKQTDWLKAKLAETAPTNTFVLTHYLPTVPGVRTYLRISDHVEASNLMKLALENRVAAWLGGHHHSYALGEVEGVKYLLAGGGGGRRMEPVLENFFVQCTVSGGTVSFTRRTVE